METITCLRSGDIQKVAIFRHAHTEAKASVPDL